MGKIYDEHLKHIAELEKAQKSLANSANTMSDMTIISTQLLAHTALIADISESLAVIADKMGGAE